MMKKYVYKNKKSGLRLKCILKAWVLTCCYIQLTADLDFGRPEVNVLDGAVLKRKLQNLWISLDLGEI